VRAPEGLEGGSELQPEQDLRSGRPVEGRAKILSLGERDLPIERLVVVLVEMCSLGDLEHALGVATTD
jgi:hypothetical protein